LNLEKKHIVKSQLFISYSSENKFRYTLLLIWFQGIHINIYFPAIIYHSTKNNKNNNIYKIIK